MIYQEYLYGRHATVISSFRLRTMRGTFKYFEVGDLVKMIHWHPQNSGRTVMVQPLNSKGRPSTNFPYIVSMDNIEAV